MESGLPKTLVTRGGTEIESFGHEVTIQTLGVTLTSVVYFAKYPGINRNFLGRVGWLRNLRFCVVDCHPPATKLLSTLEDPEQIETVVSEMEKYRGFIEGGLCIRRVEDFIAGSERRYFVLNRTPYAAEPGEAIPEPVAFCAEAIASSFFSVDVARRTDGVDRIVEIGDGQVSDLVGWSVERFVGIWSEAR